VKSIIISALILLALATDSRAGTEVLTFDDLPVPGYAFFGVAVVPNGYGSLVWDNFSYLDSTQVEGLNGYLNGTVSGQQLAFNGQGALPASISDPTPFNVNAVYMTAAWDITLSVEVVGSRNGTVMYDRTFDVVDTGPTLFSLNYLNVDRVQFISLSGTRDFAFQGQGDEFAIDNLSVTVPEPAIPAVAAFAALVLAIIRSRSEHAPA
jgi:hypothetical protein